MRQRRRARYERACRPKQGAVYRACENGWGPDLDYIIPFFAVLFLLFTVRAQATDTWHALQDRSLEVAAGSVLDFSALRPDNSAGERGWVQRDRNGHLRFEGETRPQRFLCASMVPSEPNGSLPGRAEADRWVEQLTRAGYNLVRLHFMDAILMTGRSEDFDYDPIGMDRLQYLMARLKSAGIYWVVDGLTSDNGAYGNVQPHRWVNQHDLKGRLFYDPAAVEHWKQLVTTMWGRKTPYPGLAPISDPAMLGIILVNEQSLAVYLESLKIAPPAELENRFQAWQTLGGQSNDALASQSRKQRASATDKGGIAGIPKKLRENNRIARDFAAFSAGEEASLFLGLDNYVRNLGFKGLTSSYNNRSFYHADLARSEADWVDMHAYQSIPTRFTLQGSRLEQTSIFDDVGRYGRELANARQWGKPFTVTEYGQPFWNQWRYESAGWIPTMAAFQDWGAICQFAELPVLLEYGKSVSPRRRAMYPFGVGADPITRGGERLSALLFLRGDVVPSRVRVKLGLNPEWVFSDGSAWGKVPENLSRLALVAASGLDLSKSPTRLVSNQEIYFPLGSRPGSWVEKTTNEALKRGILIGKDPVAQLKESGLLSRSNRTDLSEGLYETDTGQVLFDARRKRLLITTERTVVFTQRSGSAKAGGVELTALSSPATVGVGALDDRAIGQSRRLLIWVLTDAINTGMEFSDPE
ncbi:MAG TPA: hypothetical protein PKD55_20000, partial [Bellilinea sp.]|nr:hypothetical protein [Bellilinea sp.]